MQVSEECKNLNEYLQKFEFSISLLQTKEAISQAVYGLEEELKQQGLMYAEIRFAPQFHCQKGLSQEEVVIAALEGHRKSNFNANIILCCMRMKENQKENLETIRLAEKYLGKGICAVDLAGAEALYPNENFKELFDKIRERRLPFTIHAGEGLGAKSVVSAMEYGAARIGHGIRCVEDETIKERVAKEKVFLELCPTSNLHTNIYENLLQYPIPLLKQAGVKFTINTDNMSVSGTTIKKEWEELIRAFGLSQKDVKQCLENSIEAAFLEEEEKENLRKQLNTSLN